MIVSKNIRMNNEMKKYDDSFDFSEEPKSADLDYIEEYAYIFEFDATDDDSLGLIILLRMKLRMKQ